MRTAGALLLVAALSACGGEAEVLDKSTGHDAGSYRVDSGHRAPSVLLLAHNVEADSVELTVRGRGLANVYGIAFRIRTDPSALTLNSFEPVSSFWRDIQVDPIAIGRQADDGLSVYAVTAEGERSGRPAEDEALAIVRFVRHGGAATPLRFVSERSAVFDDSGAPLADVSWRGGELSAARVD